MVRIIRAFLVILLLIIPFFGFSQLKPGKQLLNRKATFYHNKFVNRKTTSGEKFVQTKYTAAHKTIPLNTLVKVTNEKNGRSVIVKVNDRCPKIGVIDLSLVAAKRLKMIKQGVAKVKIEILSDDYLDIWEKQDEIFNMFDSVGEKKSLNTSYFDSRFFEHSMNIRGGFLNQKDSALLIAEIQIKRDQIIDELSSKYVGIPMVFFLDNKQYYYVNIDHFKSFNS